VAEERERAVGERHDHVGEGVRELVEPLDRRLGDAALAAREPQRAEADALVEERQPRPERRGAGAGMREAEDPGLGGVVVGAAERDPGRRRGRAAHRAPARR